MKWLRPFALATALLIAAVPLGAAIKAMNLKETMEITDETVHGRIVATETFRHDVPIEGGVYTRLFIEGTSLRTGAAYAGSVVFFGSHDPENRFFMSEMPQLRDVRLGNEVLFFSGKDPAVDGANNVYNHGGVYRVERGFGEPVVIGKGEGFAFPGNTKLADARKQIETAHRLILSERAAAQGLGPAK